MKVWLASMPQAYTYPNAARMLTNSVDYFMARGGPESRLRVRHVRNVTDGEYVTGQVLQVWRDAAYVHEFGVEIALP